MLASFRAHQTALSAAEAAIAASPPPPMSSSVIAAPLPPQTAETGAGRRQKPHDASPYCPLSLRCHTAGRSDVHSFVHSPSGGQLAHTVSVRTLGRVYSVHTVHGSGGMKSLRCPGRRCCRLAATARTTPTTWRRPGALQTRMYRHLALALVAAHIAAPVEFALAEFYSRLVTRRVAPLTAEQVTSVDRVRTLQTDAINPSTTLTTLVNNQLCSSELEAPHSIRVSH